MIYTKDYGSVYYTKKKKKKKLENTNGLLLRCKRPTEKAWKSYMVREVTRK